MTLKGRKIKDCLPAAILTLLMAVGSALSLFSAMDTADCINRISTPWNGLLQFENAFLLFLTRKTGRIHLLFTCVQNRDYIFVVLLLSAVCALLCLHAVRKKNVYAVLPVALLFAVGYAAGFLRSAIGCALVLGGFLLLFSHCVGGRNFLYRSLAVALCFGVLFTAVSLAHTPSPQKSMTAALTRAGHALRYEKHDALPEGDLRRDTAKYQTDDIALTVEMDKPQSVYLRSFTGECFDGVRWTPLGNDTLAGYADLFYWLHEYGFYSTNQQALALETVQDYKPMQVTVTNHSACKKYAYLPTVCKADALFDHDALRETLLAPGDTYSAEMPVYDKASLFAAQRKLARNTNQNPEYLQCERAYAQFVYDTALELSDTMRDTLDTLVEENLQEAGLADKICFVLEWFEDYAHTPSPTAYSGDDAAVWFVEQSHCGNDAMFATASVLMLRYLGIPARYAEGYRTEGGEVKRSDAHAWAEYYLDGMGWIPLETLPELTRKEMTYYQEEEGETDDPIENAELQSIDNPQDEPDSDYRTSHGTIAPLIIAGGGVLLLFAAILLLRQLRFRRKMRKIRAQEPKAQIPALYAYAQYVQKECAVSVSDEEAHELQQEALFSNHDLSDHHVQQMESYVHQTIDNCKQSDSRLKKLKHRFWDCLY